jgi:hypothetical protein
VGYTTTFDGHISVDPPLNRDEITYLDEFANTRRMACEQGPYCVQRTSTGMQGIVAGSKADRLYVPNWSSEVQ